MSDDTAIALVPDTRNLMALADNFIESGLFPSAKSMAGAVTIIEYGREMGLPPAVSLQTMSIVSGRICLEAKVMLGLFQKQGGQIEIVKKGRECSEVKFTKAGRAPHVERFTIEDAKQLGFLGKQNWKGYPEEMCYWRCIAKGIRAYDPMVTMGIYSVEEVRDFDVAPSAPAVVAPVPLSAKVEDVEIIPEAPVPASASKFDYLANFKKARVAMGDSLYYEIMGQSGYEHANEIPVDKRKAILDTMSAAHKLNQGGAK